MQVTARQAWQGGASQGKFRSERVRSVLLCLGMAGMARQAAGGWLRFVSDRCGLFWQARLAPVVLGSVRHSSVAYGVFLWGKVRPGRQGESMLVVFS